MDLLRNAVDIAEAKSADEVRLEHVSVKHFAVDLERVTVKGKVPIISFAFTMRHVVHDPVNAL